MLESQVVRIEADSMEEAVRIAAEFPWVHTGCVEVREVKDIDAERARVSSAEGTRATPA